MRILQNTRGIGKPQSLSSPQDNHPSDIQKKQKKAKDRSMNHHPQSHPLDVSIHAG